jgi:hypothetical protein
MHAGECFFAIARVIDFQSCLDQRLADGHGERSLVLNQQYRRALCQFGL